MYSPTDNAAAVAELLDTAPDLHAANLADSLEGLGSGNRRRHGAGEGKAGGDGGHAGHGTGVRAALARGAGEEADEAEHDSRCFGFLNADESELQSSEERCRVCVPDSFGK